MSKLSETSRRKLATCHTDLQKLINAVSEKISCAVICGYRGKFEQEKAFREGRSKAIFGKSKHNASPSLAVDIVPIPLDWNNIESFEKLGTIVEETAKELGISIKWGKYFKNLVDYPHFELVEKVEHENESA